ncbi:hypothetical protein SLEP1_g56884, partial [Rubroshorea leprosula]
MPSNYPELELIDSFRANVNT